jgi:hypothetical protein
MVPDAKQSVNSMPVPTGVMEGWHKMTNTNQQLDQLTALKERLTVKKTKLSEKLVEVEKHLEAVTTTLALLNRGEEKDEDITLVVPPRELHGLTQLEALIHIAKRKNNRVKIIEAKKLLSKAGLLNGAEKNWYNLLFTIIKRSEKFQHVGPGEYELQEDGKSVLPLRKVAG